MLSTSGTDQTIGNPFPKNKGHISAKSNDPIEAVTKSSTLSGFQIGVRGGDEASLIVPHGTEMRRITHAFDQQLRSCKRMHYHTAEMYRIVLRLAAFS